MSVATSTAIAIGAGASALGSVAAAKINSGASKTAATDQANAAQAALDFTKQQKAAQEAAAAPYLAAGGNAAAHLTGAIRPTPAGGPPAPYGVAPGSMPQGQQTGYSTLSTMGQPAYGNTSQPAPAAPAAPSAGAMVMLQAPDGSTKSVPASVAAQYVAKGAKVVG